MNNPASQNITILHDTKEWSTDLDGEIGEIRVDGRRLDDIHDLSRKLEQSNMYIVEVTKRIKTMSYIATTLAIIAVASTGYIGGWLMSNQDKISTTMDTAEERFSKRINELHSSKRIMGEKLKSLGWMWRDGGWQQIGNNEPKFSK